VCVSLAVGRSDAQSATAWLPPSVRQITFVEGMRSDNRFRAPGNCRRRSEGRPMRETPLLGWLPTKGADVGAQMPPTE
jgi:hypothetical protein